MKAIQRIFETPKLFFWSIKHYYKSSPIMFVVSYVLTIATSLFYLGYVKFQANLIDSFTRIELGATVIIVPLIVFLGYTFLTDAISYVQNSFVDRIGSSKTEKYFTELFLHHYSGLDIGRIEQSDFQDLKTKVSDRGLWQMRRVPAKIALIIAQIITLIVGIGIISTINPLAALCVVLGTIPMFMVDINYTSANTRLWDEYTTQRRIFWSERNTVESKRSIQELIVSNRVSKILIKVFRFVNDNYRREISLEKKYFLPNIVAIIISTASIGIALLFIVYQALHGKLTAGQIVFSMGVLYQIKTSVSTAMSNLASLKEVLPYVRYTKDFFEIKPLVTSSSESITIDEHQAIEVVFEAVSFSYPGQEKNVVHNISFTIHSGEKLALVGLNGAGKSTLIKLLLRMYDPTAGRILINGVDLRHINLISWYEYLGVLLQDSSRYEFLSVKETVQLFAREKISDHEIHSLLKSIRAESIVDDSEKGLDMLQSTEYGGQELSGGQFQKIALARILARNAKLIVLDEPTSSIDALSEEKIFETLHKLPKHITMLFISHRFTTIRNAERIIVLDGGTISEQGTHKELIKNKALYAEMYTTQVLGK
jgi:ATP-binding cassette subfamily B protein